MDLSDTLSQVDGPLVHFTLIETACAFGEEPILEDLPNNV